MTSFDAREENAFENIVVKEDADNQHFSFSLSVSYPKIDEFYPARNIYFVICKYFKFGQGQTFCRLVKDLSSKAAIVVQGTLRVQYIILLCAELDCRGERTQLKVQVIQSSIGSTSSTYKMTLPPSLKDAFM